LKKSPRDRRSLEDTRDQIDGCRSPTSTSAKAHVADRKEEDGENQQEKKKKTSNDKRVPNAKEGRRTKRTGLQPEAKWDPIWSALR